MSRRPVTLFTGQWADLPFTVVCREGARMGLRRPRARLLGRPSRRGPGATEDDYVDKRKQILADHGLSVLAISNHLIGQAVCDHPIDERHRRHPAPRVWGDGSPKACANGPPRT